MLIEPNTNIRILSGVPLDNTYTNTLYFESLSAQVTYFSGRTKYSLTEQSYQRASKGTMRVELETEKLYDCNYLMFQNRAFGTKWFYAFITDIQYVNNVTSQITYEIDEMQTWLLGDSYDLKECYVEREHITNDSFGANLVPENFSLPRFQTADKVERFFSTSSDWLVVLLISNSDGTSGGIVKDTTFIPYTKMEFNLSAGAQAIKDAISSAVENQSRILGIYQIPADVRERTQIDVPSMGTSINGYIPKNKKLFSHPYNYLEGRIGNVVQEYKYEMFESPTLPKFRRIGNGSVAPFGMGLIPIRYAGDTDDVLDYSMMAQEMPQIGWSESAYDNFMAQKSEAFHYGLVSNGIISGLTALASASIEVGSGGIPSANNLVGGVSSIASNIVGFEQQKIEAKHTKPTVNAPINGDLALLNGYFGYQFKRKAIDQQTAERIDKYFSRYGYATNTVKVPNTHNRPHWNYVKTRDCVITGKMPADSMKRVCTIYDKGITFWKNPSEVGNFSLDNSPTFE